jgi:hypothetical protein
MLSGTGFVAAPETFENPPQTPTTASLNGMGYLSRPTFGDVLKSWLASVPRTFQSGCTASLKHADGMNIPSGRSFELTARPQ